MSTNAPEYVVEEFTESDVFPAPRPFDFSVYSRRYPDYYHEEHKRRRRNASRRKVLEQAFLLALVTGGMIVLMAVILMFLPPASRTGTGAGAGAGNMNLFSSSVDNSILSTPKSEWRKGIVPHLYQVDSAWKDEAYGDGTIETHGCGPTALSMVYVAITGKTDMDPKTMAAFSERGGYLDNGITSWLLMSDGAQQLGMSSKELQASASAVRSALNMGLPVIASVGEGDFTTDGHFIVLSGLNQDGTIKVNDPNSPERSSQTWSIERILQQTRNLWVFNS